MSDDYVKIDVGAVDEFPVGTFKVVNVEGSMEIGILRREDGRWLGLRNACPHHLAPICRGQVSGTMLPAEEGSVEFVYGMDGQIIRCPWHGYEYNLDSGHSVMDSAPGRLRLFEVEPDGGRVLLRMKQRVSA